MKDLESIQRAVPVAPRSSYPVMSFYFKHLLVVNTLVTMGLVVQFGLSVAFKEGSYDEVLFGILGLLSTISTALLHHWQAEICDKFNKEYGKS